MARSRSRKKPPKSLGRAIGMLMVVNIVPLLVIAYLGVQYARGEITIDEDQIPAGLNQTLMWVGGVIVALLIIASLTLPATHRGVKALQMTQARHRAVIKGEAEGSRVGALLASPFLHLVLGFAKLARFVFILISFALIALLFFFLARLKWPELGQEWVEKALEWGGSWGS